MEVTRAGGISCKHFREPRHQQLRLPHRDEGGQLVVRGLQNHGSLGGVPWGHRLQKVGYAKANFRKGLLNLLQQLQSPTKCR